MPEIETTSGGASISASLSNQLTQAFTELVALIGNDLETVDIESLAPADVDQLSNNLSKAFPIGAADVTALQDFVSHVLATENIYAIPTEPKPPACLPLIMQAAVDHFKTLSASHASRGYTLSDGPLGKAFAGFNRLPKKERLKFLRCFLAESAKIFKVNDEIVDVEALEQLARSIDGLVDSDGYLFDIFQPGTINLGLRLVYRQEWTPLRYQVGEQLGTIPMGALDKFKYETRGWQTTKTAQELNESAMYSTEEVLSTTKRDIREMTDQLTKKRGGKAEASGAINLGVVKFGGGASGSVEHSSESKRMKQTFLEEMAKATSSIRNERKLTFTISKEEGVERKVTHETSNPNDETTLTYVLYELQRIYGVTQFLYDVIPVVYVAMDVPAPTQITVDWIRKHDWILAGAILDKSFTEPLSFITTEWPSLEDTYRRSLAVFQQAAAVVDAIKEEIAQSEEEIGQSPVPIIQDLILQIQLRSLTSRLKAALEATAAAEKELRTAEIPYRNGLIKVHRLQDHIRDNILHYMQVIWASEVPEQRYLRMRTLLYPDIKRTANGFEVAKWLPLADVVDTDRPLGYVGNYAVFRLARSDNAVINHMASFYIKHIKGDIFQVSDPDESEQETVVVNLPTDSIYIDALVGKHSVMEPFKVRHRAKDPVKVTQEIVAQKLENLRRLLLLVQGRYGDPAVEKLVLADSKLVDRLMEIGAKTV